MNNIVFKQRLVSFVFGISICAISGSVFGADSSEAAPQAASSVSTDDCSKELLLAYFPKQFVNETLKKFNVPQDKWDSINKALSEKDKEVIKIVEEKAAQMNPNPLKDPQQRQAAVKIFRETLLQIFSDVMKANGISDEQQIQAMLDDVQQQKARRFAQCMERQRGAQPQMQQPPQGGQGMQKQLAPHNSNDESDEDSDEETEE